MPFHCHLAARLALSVTGPECLDLVPASGRPLAALGPALSAGPTDGAVTGVLDRLEAARLVPQLIPMGLG